MQFLFLKLTPQASMRVTLLVIPSFPLSLIYIYILLCCLHSKYKDQKLTLKAQITFKIVLLSYVFN